MREGDPRNQIRSAIAGNNSLYPKRLYCSRDWPPERNFGSNVLVSAGLVVGDVLRPAR